MDSPVLRAIKLSKRLTGTGWSIVEDSSESLEPMTEMLEREPWFMKEKTREEAEALLKKTQSVFLVRYDPVDHRNYCSLKTEDGSLLHLPIARHPNGYYLEGTTIKCNARTVPALVLLHPVLQGCTPFSLSMTEGSEQKGRFKSVVKAISTLRKRSKSSLNEAEFENAVTKMRSIFSRTLNELSAHNDFPRFCPSIRILQKGKSFFFWMNE